MNRRILRAWPCLVALACTRPPASGDHGAALAAADALARARLCAGALERLEPDQTGAVAEALGIEPVRLAPVRGRPEELGTIRAAVEDRLEEARASTGAARALARLESEDPAVPRGQAEERARRSARAADALCRAASAVETERLARRDAGRP